MIELMIVIGIMAVLTTLIFVGWSMIIAKSEKVQCMGNLRSLQTSLNSYIQDVGHWPQIPEELDAPGSGNDNAYEDWWLEELKNYGGTPEVWQCPTIKRMVISKSPDGRPKLSYTPTPFDALAFTPYKWSTQPWLVEIGNIHGGGALICFPDGSIKTMNDILGR